MLIGISCNRIDKQILRRKIDEMDDKVIRLKRELKCKGTITNYYTDTVQLPNGNTAQWDFVGHNGAAATVPVLPDGRILMVKQYRNALDRYTLEIPAGGLLTDEPTVEAAARELEEETGYICGKIELLLQLRTTVAFCNEKIDIYYATDLKKSQQHLDEDEFLSVMPYELEELEKMIYEGVIQDSKTIAAIFAYKNKYLL